MMKYSTLALKIAGMGLFGAMIVGYAQADDLLDLLQNKTSEKAAPTPGNAANSAAEKYNLQAMLSKEVPRFTAEQNIFAGFFNQGEMAKALYQWPSAFEKAEFRNTPTGKALYSFLLFENGLHVMGTESLFSIETPDKIAPGVIKLWRDELNSGDPVWGVAQVRWNPYWTEVFGPAAEVLVSSRQNFQPSDVEKLKELLKKSAPDTRERAMLEWQLVLALSMNDDAPQAAKVLAHLVKADKNPIGADLMNMTASRLLFQNGYLDAAIQYYKKIDKTSDYWFDAQEESAWSYIRKGEPQNTLAVTKTLVNPVFTAQVGPETVFLQAMAQLKVCDYQAVTKTLGEFKDRFRPRASVLTGIVQDAPSVPAVSSYITHAKEKIPTLKQLGSDVKALPRFVTRDARLNDLIRLEKQLDVEKKIASDLYGRSVAEGTAQVGFQASLDQFRQQAEQRQVAAHNAALGRIKSLAEIELKEISQTLQKMHIVEAEVLQQISLSNRLVKTDVDKIMQKKGTTGSQARDRVSYAFDGETWFDELANYKIDVNKACQKTR